MMQKTQIGMIIIFSFFMSACFTKEKKPKYSEISLRERLNHLSQKLVEKQNEVEDLKTENSILKKIALNKTEKSSSFSSPSSISSSFSPSSQSFEKKKNQPKKRKRKTPPNSQINPEINSQLNSKKKARKVKNKDKPIKNFNKESPDLTTVKKHFTSLNDSSETSTLEKNRFLTDTNQPFQFQVPNPKMQKLKLKNLTYKNPNFKNSSKKKSQEENSNIYAKARKAYKASNFQKLKMLSQLSLKNQPKGFYTDDILFLFGKLSIRKGLYEEGLKILNRLLEYYPESNRKVSALLWKGVAYEKLKRGKQAFFIFKRLIKEHPESLEAFHARKKVEKSKHSTLTLK